MIKNKPTYENRVLLIRYCPDTNSSAKTIDICQEPQGLLATGNGPAESFS